MAWANFLSQTTHPTFHHKCLFRLHYNLSAVKTNSRPLRTGSNTSLVVLVADHQFGCCIGAKLRSTSQKWTCIWNNFIVTVYVCSSISHFHWVMMRLYLKWLSRAIKPYACDVTHNKNFLYTHSKLVRAWNNLWKTPGVRFLGVKLMQTLTSFSKIVVFLFVCYPAGHAHLLVPALRAKGNRTCNWKTTQQNTTAASE